MKKLLYSLPITLLSLLCTYPNYVYAGGTNIILKALNTGITGEAGVEIRVTVFDPYVNTYNWEELSLYTLDPTNYNPIGIDPSRELKIDFVNAKKGQYCKMNTSKTDEYGQVNATCYSNDPGKFSVGVKFETDEPLYNGGPNANTSYAYTTVDAMFFGKKLKEPKKEFTPPNIQPDDIIPESTKEATPTITPTAYLNELETRVKELQDQVEKQQNEISTLKKIINRIQEIFKGLFE